MTLRPIGILRTPFVERAQCPRNGRQLDPAPVCTAELDPEFLLGTQDLDGFSHLIVLYWLHEIEGAAMVFTPPFDDAPRGLFASRVPARPNPIGLSVVAFDGFAGPGVLRVRWLDCIDRTPLLDIKPYLPSTDSVPDASMGWLERHRTR